MSLLHPVEAHEIGRSVTHICCRCNSYTGMHARTGRGQPLDMLCVVAYSSLHTFLSHDHIVYRTNLQLHCLLAYALPEHCVIPLLPPLPENSTDPVPTGFANLQQLQDCLGRTLALKLIADKRFPLPPSSALSIAPFKALQILTVSQSQHRLKTL